MSSVMAETLRLTNLEEWDQIGDVFICVNTGLIQGWEGIGKLYQSNEYSHLLLEFDPDWSSSAPMIASQSRGQYSEIIKRAVAFDTAADNQQSMFNLSYFFSH
jgi:hypothetical protein